TYRQTKGWVLSGQKTRHKEPTGLFDEFSRNKITIFVSILLMALVSVAQAHCPPRMAFIQFYFLPLLISTLVINRRWGTMIAVVVALLGPAVQVWSETGLLHWRILIWNCVMRFLLFETFVLLLDRIRRETVPAVKNDA